MLALIVKGIEFEDTCLSFGEKEHKTPEFLAINPRGRVPALVDGDTTVYESLAIMAYADRIQTETPLFGRDAAQAATIFRIVSEHDSYLYPAGLALIGPAFRGEVSEATPAMSKAAEALRSELATLKTSLADNDWLAGDAVSAADLVVYPTLMLSSRILARPDIAKLALGVDPFTDPALKAWKDRLEAIPGVDRAHPPHWRS